MLQSYIYCNGLSVEVIALNAFGDGIFEKSKGEALVLWDQCFYEKRSQRSCSLPLSHVQTQQDGSPL